jgi:hypothetical protein
MADPIVEKTIAAQGADHQALLDRIGNAFKGLWAMIERDLPDHALKSQVLDGLKSGYEGAATVVSDDYAALKKQGEQDVETAAGQVETEVQDVASAVVATPTSVPSSSSASATSPTGTSASAASDKPAS